MPCKAKIVLTADAVENMRLIRCPIDERRISATVIVARVEQIEANEQTTSLNLCSLILTEAFRILFGVEDGVKVRNCGRHLSSGLCIADFYVDWLSRRTLQDDASVTMKRHRQITTSLGGRRFERCVREVREEVFERTCDRWVSFIVPING